MSTRWTVKSVLIPIPLNGIPRNNNSHTHSSSHHDNDACPLSYPLRKAVIVSRRAGSIDSESRNRASIVDALVILRMGNFVVPIKDTFPRHVEGKFFHSRIARDDSRARARRRDGRGEKTVFAGIR